MALREGTKGRGRGRGWVGGGGGGCEQCGVRILAIVQVEKEAGHVLVVDPAAPVGLVLGDELNTQRVKTPVQSKPQSLTGTFTLGNWATCLSAVLRDKLVLLNWLFDEGAPSGHV